MKPHTRLISALGLAALLAGTPAHAHKHNHGHPPRGDSQAALAQSKISAADAVARAEKDSGARAYNLELDLERGKAVYDIDLADSQQEHEIRIDAASGEIIARHSEYDDELPRTAAIGLQDAIANAERELGGKVIDAELEGRSAALSYELKLLKDDGTRIHAEISGADGKILRQHEKTPRHGQAPQPPAAQQDSTPPAAPAKS